MLQHNPATDFQSHNAATARRPASLARCTRRRHWPGACAPCQARAHVFSKCRQSMLAQQSTAGSLIGNNSAQGMLASNAALPHHGTCSSQRSPRMRRASCMSLGMMVTLQGRKTVCNAFSKQSTLFEWHGSFAGIVPGWLASLPQAMLQAPRESSLLSWVCL